MSEATIQAGIQATIQALVGFDNTDVVINDWSVLDDPNTNGPYVIIETASVFVSRQATAAASGKWDIPVTLFCRFVDWETTSNAVRDNRAAILTAFTASGARSPAINTSVNEIRGSELVHIPNPNMPDGDPIFIAAPMVFDTEEI